MFGSGARILITGGTGSFGLPLSIIAQNYGHTVERLVVFSRDELKQWEMQQTFPPEIPPAQILLGDIRDKDRLVPLWKELI